jgi:hypothetical protein
MVIGVILHNVDTRDYGIKRLPPPFRISIAFAVASSVDSRVILDMPGAETLLGKGDMLYLASDAGHPARVQGCFVAEDELERVAQFWRDQAGPEEEEAPWERMMRPATAQAGELGAPAPYAKEGKYAASLGYSYYNDVKVKGDEGDTSKLTQNQFTLEGDYGLAKGWEVFLRIGMADTKAEDFHSDYTFLGTLGFRGLFYESGPFGVGGTIVGTYYGEFKDGDVKFTNPYELASASPGSRGPPLRGSRGRGVRRACRSPLAGR